MNEKKRKYLVKEETAKLEKEYLGIVRNAGTCYQEIVWILVSEMNLTEQGILLAFMKEIAPHKKKESDSTTYSIRSIGRYFESDINKIRHYIDVTYICDHDVYIYEEKINIKAMADAIWENKVPLATQIDKLSQIDPVFELFK